MPVIDDIFNAVRDAINPASPYSVVSDIDTATRNMEASARGMQQDANKIKTTVDTELNTLNTSMADLAKKEDQAILEFDNVSKAIFQELSQIKPSEADQIDKTLLKPEISIADHIPGQSELAIHLDQIPAARDAGIHDVSGEIAGSLQQIDKPPRAKSLAEYGIGESPSVNGIAAAEQYMTVIMRALTDFGDIDTDPHFTQARNIGPLDVRAYMPDFTGVRGAHTELLADLDRVKLAMPDLSRYQLDYAPFVSKLDAVWLIVERNLQGGTGLDPKAEQALWERNRERNLRAIHDQVKALSSMVAGRGFSMPPGMIAKSAAAMMNKQIDADLDTSRDITFKQADLAQSNMIAAVDSAIKMNAADLEAWSKSLELQIEYNKFMVGIATEAFRVEAETVRARTEILLGIGRLIELELKELDAEVTVKKLEYEENQRITAENRNKVELVRTRVELETARTEYYRLAAGLIEAIVRADSLKLQAYTAKLQEYDAYIRTVEADYRRYSEDIKAALLPADVQKILVEAYNANVSGISTRNSAESKRVESVVSKFAALVSAYHANVNVGTNEVERYAKTQGAYNEKYRLDISREVTKLDTATKKLDALNKANEFKVSLMKEQLNLIAGKIKTYADVLLKGDQGEIDAYAKQIDALSKAVAGAYQSVSAIGVDVGRK